MRENQDERDDNKKGHPTLSQASEEEYRSVFEATSDGLVIYDIGLDCVIEANPAACEMHGYTRQEFIGLNPTVFIPLESHALFIEQVRTAETGKVLESLLVHK